MEGHDENKKHNGKRHDKAFKVAAAKLVTEQGYTPKKAAVSLSVRATANGWWRRLKAVTTAIGPR